MFQELLKIEIVSVQLYTSAKGVEGVAGVPCVLSQTITDYGQQINSFVSSLLYMKLNLTADCTTLH